MKKEVIFTKNDLKELLKNAKSYVQEKEISGTTTR